MYGWDDKDHYQAECSRLQDLLSGVREELSEARAELRKLRAENERLVGKLSTQKAAFMESLTCPRCQSEICRCSR